MSSLIEFVDSDFNGIFWIKSYNFLNEQKGSFIENHGCRIDSSLNLIAEVGTRQFLSMATNDNATTC